MTDESPQKKSRTDAAPAGSPPPPPVNLQAPYHRRSAQMVKAALGPGATLHTAEAARASRCFGSTGTEWCKVVKERPGFYEAVMHDTAWTQNQYNGGSAVTGLKVPQLIRIVPFAGSPWIALVFERVDIAGLIPLADAPRAEQAVHTMQAVLGVINYDVMPQPAGYSNLFRSSTDDSIVIATDFGASALAPEAPLTPAEIQNAVMQTEGLEAPDVAAVREGVRADNSTNPLVTQRLHAPVPIGAAPAPAPATAPAPAPPAATRRLFDDDDDDDDNDEEEDEEEQQ